MFAEYTCFLSVVNLRRDEVLLISSQLIIQKWKCFRFSVIIEYWCSVCSEVYNNLCYNYVLSTESLERHGKYRMRIKVSFLGVLKSLPLGRLTNRHVTGPSVIWSTVGSWSFLRWRCSRHQGTIIDLCTLDSVSFPTQISHNCFGKLDMNEYMHMLLSPLHCKRKHCINDANSPHIHALVELTCEEFWIWRYRGRSNILFLLQTVHLRTVCWIFPRCM